MAKITVDGREYTLPELSEITMGQARVIKRYTGLTLNTLGKADATDPDLIAAFCHLAIMGDVNGSFAEIEEIVNDVKFAALDFTPDEEPEAAVEDDARPPAVTNIESALEKRTSGSPSTPTSAATPETTPLSTGTAL